MPTAYVNSVDDFRKALGKEADAFSDEQLLKELADSTGTPIHEAAVKFKYDTNTGPWSEKTSSSVDAYQSGMYGTLKAGANVFGLQGVADFANRRQQANKISSEVSANRAREGGIPDSYEDVDGIGSFARYAGGIAVGSLPYAAEALVGGVAGRMLKGAAMGAEALSGMSAAQRATTMGRAGLAGGVAASYPSSVGDILNSQEEQTEKTGSKTNIGVAAALGLPYALANAFGESRIAATLKGPKSGVQALDRMTGFRGGAARTAATGARLGVEEGIGEVFQEGMNEFGRMSVDPNEQFFSPEAVKRYRESGVGGFTLGSALGGGLRGWRRSNHGTNGNSSPMNPEGGDPGPTPDGPINLLGYDPTVGNGRMYAFPDGSVATGEEAAFAQRMAPQPLGQTAYDQAVSSSPMAPSAVAVDPVSYTPIDALAVQTTTGLRLLSTEATNVQARDWGNGIPFDTPQVAPTQAMTPSGRVGSLDTAGLSTAPTEAQSVVQRAGIQPAEQQPQVQQPAPEQKGDREAPPITPKAPATPDGIAASEHNQTRIQSAHEAIGRAQDAGMKTEKQQTSFWRAEQLAKDGKLDESKLTQVLALLTQHMLPKANKILDEAAAGVGHDDLLAKFKAIDSGIAEMDKHEADQHAADAELAQLTEQKDQLGSPGTGVDARKHATEAGKLTKQIAKVKAKREAAIAKHKAAFDHVQQLKKTAHSPQDEPATAAPIAVRNVEAAPRIEAPVGGQTGATGTAAVEAKAKKTGADMKSKAAEGAKLNRYQALLACLK